MKDSLSHCGEFAKSIQALLNGQAGYQIEAETGKCYFTQRRTALLLLCIGDARLPAGAGRGK